MPSAAIMTLYNFKDDPTTVQPTPDCINTFLNKIKLPSLLTDQLPNLNEPLTQLEICKAIDYIPCNKA